MQNYLDKNGFTQVFTPCLMGVASESGSEVFEVCTCPPGRTRPAWMRTRAVARGEAGSLWEVQLAF